MFARLSLKARVNLIIAAILTGIVAIGSLLVIRHVRESVARETESALQLARGMIEASRLQGPLPADLAARWMAMLERLHRTRHVRLWVIHDSQDHPPPPAAGSLPSVPAWFATLVRPPPMRIEQQLPIRQGGTLRVILAADPSDEIAEAWKETQVFLGLILLLAAGCFIALTWVLGRAFRPVDRMLEGLVALERGDYHHRLPDFPQPEWRRIAAAFNHCAGVLEQARADNRNLTRQLLKVEEEERRALARELHDELGQVLSAIKVMAQSIKKHRRREQAIQAAGLISEQVDHLFATIRAMIHRLRPLMLDDLGLTAALDALVADWRRRQPEIRIALHCEPEVDSFPADQQIHVYRMVQESLTNAFKHARPHTIHIGLKLEFSEVPRCRWLKVQVSDDGCGALGIPAQGYGLRGMRERVESLGGRFHIATAPGQGFTLTILLPFEEEPSDTHPRHARG